MKKIDIIIAISMTVLISFMTFNIGYNCAENKLNKSREIGKIPFDFRNFGSNYIGKNINYNFIDSFQIDKNTYHIHAFKVYANEKRTYKISYLIDIEYYTMRELIKDFKSDNLPIDIHYQTLMGKDYTQIIITDVKYLEALERARMNKFDHKRMTEQKELHKKIYNN